MRGKAGFLQIIGIVLIIASAGLLCFQEYMVKQAQEANLEVAEQIVELLPEKRIGTPADYSEPEMPVLQIDGVDYVCLLEVPAFGITLPIQNQWGNSPLNRQPSRFWGSIYGGTCILGGSNYEGQFDFCTQVDVGDTILVTDMQGTQFSFRVSRIDRVNTTDFDQLYDETHPLVLFARDRYDDRYIVVRCAWLYAESFY